MVTGGAPPCIPQGGLGCGQGETPPLVFPNSEGPTPAENFNSLTTWEVVTGSSVIQGHSLLCSEFEDPHPHLILETLYQKKT